MLVVGHVLLGVSLAAATGSRWRCSSCAGVICFALLGVALSHAIPNPESAPAYVNAVFLPQILIAGVFYDADEAPTIIHDIAQALPLTHLVDGLSGAMVDGEGVGRRTGSRCSCWRCGRRSARVLAVRGFSWEARREG